MNIGYAVVELATGTVLARGVALPLQLSSGGMQVSFDRVGLVAPDSTSPLWRCVERELVSVPPVEPHQTTDEEESFDGVRVLVTRTYALVPLPTSTELADDLDALVLQADNVALGLRALISLLGDRIFSNDSDPASRDTKAKAALRARAIEIANGARG